ncbi:MAG TPA: nuclear transport factor 2 family protein [Pyrinomonadaceae bacterium]
MINGLMNNFVSARSTNFLLRACVLALVCLSLTNSSNAQTGNDAKGSRELYDRVAALDAALFDAYNRCDIDKVGTFFTEDLEFYHEKGGLTLTRDATLATMRKNLCSGDGYHLRRESVEGSMEVRPINNYGAVQTGEHRFYLTQKGRKEALDGVCKFVMLWRKTGDEWRVSRVISYGCRAPN